MDTSGPKYVMKECRDYGARDHHQTPITQPCRVGLAFGGPARGGLGVGLDLTWYFGPVSPAGRLVPNEPDYADHRQDYAQGCDSNCPKSVLPIAIAFHPGTSPSIIGGYCGTPLNSM